MSEALKTCARCNQPCLDQGRALCDALGIANQRLVATGFLLYDSTSGKDVPDLDTCDRNDCPGVSTEGSA